MTRSSAARPTIMSTGMGTSEDISEAVAAFRHGGGRDLILLERVSEVRDGDIVVALVAGSDTTLKRFYRESADRIRLQPANATLKPIIVPAKDVQIQGRLLAVLRKYK